MNRRAEVRVVRIAVVSPDDRDGASLLRDLGWREGRDFVFKVNAAAP